MSYFLDNNTTFSESMVTAQNIVYDTPRERFQLSKYIKAHANIWGMNKNSLTVSRSLIKSLIP